MPNPDNKDPLAPKQDNSWLEAIPIKETPWSKSTMDSNAKGVPEATPRPWLVGGLDHIASIYSDVTLRTVADHLSIGDAELIVTAVNSYDALQAQNKLLREALEYIFDHDDACECDCDNENCCVRQPSMGGVGTVFCPRCIARQAIRGEKQG